MDWVNCDSVKRRIAKTFHSIISSCEVVNRHHVFYALKKTS